MANYRDIVPHIMKWEGGISSHPADLAARNPSPFLDPATGRAIHTNKGITWQTFTSVAPKLGITDDRAFISMPEKLWLLIFKTAYWDGVKGDQINNQGIANLLAEIAWGMGAARAGQFVQAALNEMGNNLKTDNVIGLKTVAAINAANSANLFERLHRKRISFLEQLAAREPSQQANMQGWMNRINEFYTNNKKYIAGAVSIFMPLVILSVIYLATRK